MNAHNLMNELMCIVSDFRKPNKYLIPPKINEHAAKNVTNTQAGYEVTVMHLNK